MKADLRKEIASYSARRGVLELVTVPPLQYLAVDGHGDPNTAPGYQDALASLYPLAYALKFLSRRELGRDYTVPPLEGLWWADDMAVFTGARDKGRWAWTLLVLVPDWLAAEHVEAARSTVARKGGAPLLDAVRLEALDEGLCAQTLHVGPYDDEGPVLAELHERFVPEHGLRMTGRHHEVYLSDARRTAPERLRTLLRQPVRPL
ncbi:GyrI-like domain-containing protein [Cellulomonas massiliensis]|uniref:GyrI-like domain-containing protein n=1 Tax=Cellulomonas massiliensis TaxID=1465811 RepID=UPI0003173519|nr:GyrI-like domain-containing protein [Cellulomonas massiliensis]